MIPIVGIVPSPLTRCQLAPILKFERYQIDEATRALVVIPADQFSGIRFSEFILVTG
jgi:hypothetical protein